MPIIERPDWRPATPAGARETAGQPSVPATTDPKNDAPPSFSAEDVASDTDAEEIAANRKLLADKLFTVEELARFRNRTVEEIEKQTAPPPSRRSIDAELERIDRKRREDRRGYFRDEALQARERELIKAREELRAGAPAEKPAEQVGVPDALPQEVRDEWAALPGGIEENLARAQRTAQVAFDDLEPDDAAALAESFDSLPASAQTQVFRFLAVDGGAWPRADDAAVESFANSPEGKELVDSWGRDAPRHVATVKGRMGLMLQSMSESDRDKAEVWFDTLSLAQAKAVLRALAGR